MSQEGDCRIGVRKGEALDLHTGFLHPSLPFGNLRVALCSLAAPALRWDWRWGEEG